MDRWWDDPAAAVAILERVDDSDVVQGVGTAVLGYHALAKAALAPLARRTLVDPADVQDALAGVDLAPVAKALGAATRPVMGSAADRYGQLLAEQIHADAAQAAGVALTSLSAQSVPMPLAVERVAEVVGVPAKHAGSYLVAVKAAVVPEVVRKDAADRALMQYASHAGRRESNPVVPVSKAFKEAEHPRDPDGQFRDKAGSSRKPPSRLAALRERNRRAAQVKRRAAAAAPARRELGAAPRRELGAAERRELGAAPRRELGEGPRRELKALLRREVKAAEPVEAKELTSTGLLGEVKAAPKRNKPLREMKPANPFHQKMNPVAQDVNIVDDRQRRTFMVPESVANEIRVHRSFDVGQLERVLGSALVVHELTSAAQAQMAVEAGLPTHTEPLVTIVVEGAVPVRDGTPGTDEGLTLATDARMTVQAPANAWNDTVMRVSWDLEGFEGAPRISEKTAAFEEAEHPRDAEGQFTRKPRTRLAAYRARQRQAYARRGRSAPARAVGPAPVRELGAAPRRELGVAPQRELGLAPRRAVGSSSLSGLKRQAAGAKAEASSAAQAWVPLDLKKARAMVVSSYEFHTLTGMWPTDDKVGAQTFIGEPEPDSAITVFPRVTDGLTAVHESVNNNEAVTWTDGKYPTEGSAVRGISDYLADLQAGAGPNTQYTASLTEVTEDGVTVYAGLYRETNSEVDDTIILGDHEAVVSGRPVKYTLLAEGPAREVLAQFGQSLADADLTAAQKDAFIRVYEAERVHD